MSLSEQQRRLALEMNLRNKPCPCQSGKKFKKCCGSVAALAAKRREEQERQAEAARLRAEERERRQREHPPIPPGTAVYPIRNFGRSSWLATSVLVAAMMHGGRSRVR